MNLLEKFDMKRYRTERHRRNRKHVLVPVALTTVTMVILVFILSSVNSDLRAFGDSTIIFTSFAASAFIMFMMPYSKASSVRKLVPSYIMAGILGEIGYVIIPFVGFYGALAFTLFFTALLLFETDSMHPPAMGVALAFVIFHVSAPGLIILASGIIVLSVIGTIAEKLGINP